MDNKNIVAGVVGVFGGLAAILLLRKKTQGAMGATVQVAILDSSGNEVPHNSPVDLEAGGSYTVSITVTNQSALQGVPIAVDLTSSTGAMVVGEPPLIADDRTDYYEAGQSLTFTYPLQVPNYACTGEIRAIIFDLPPDDPGHQQLAVATLEFNAIVTKRPAINGMGDLDNDGYVTMADADIVKAFSFGNHISDISPLSSWEFVRRADLNCDSKIDAGDITAIKSFIAYGTWPDPIIVGRASPDGLGDLNDDGYVDGTDIILVGLLMGGYTLAEVSPLSETEAIRRADINGDGAADILDILAIINFINTGAWPQPEPIVYAASVDVGIE